MMYHYLLTLLFVFPIILFGQVHQEYISFQEHGNYEALALGQSGNLVAVGSTRSCPAFYLSYFYSAGKPAWEKTITDQLLFPATDVIFDEEQHIVVVGTDAEADDYGLPDDGIYLLKLDTLGNLLLRKKLSLGVSFPDRAHVIQLPNRQYLTAISNQLSWLSVAGDSLQTKVLNTGGEDIKDLQLGPDSSILVMGQTQWWWLDYEGSIVGQESAGELLIEAAQSADTVWIMGGAHLWEFAADRSAAEVYALPEPLIFGGVAAIRDTSSVLIWGKTDLAYYAAHLNNGEWDQVDFAFDSLTMVQDVVATKSTIYTTGLDRWENKQQQSIYALSGAFVRQLPRLTDSEAFYDLSLIDMTLSTSPRLDTVDRFVYVDTILYEVFAKFAGTVTVANTGNVTVNEFVLFSERTGGFNCGEGRFYEIISQVALQPGQTIEIPIEIYELSFSFPSDPVILSRCFYVAAPDHLADRDIRNNSACADLLVGEQPALTLPEEMINCFPNPAGAMIHLNSRQAGPIQELLLFDTAGHLQAVRADIHYDEATLYTHALPRGLYILQVVTAQGRISKKILLE